MPAGLAGRRPREALTRVARRRAAGPAALSGARARGRAEGLRLLSLAYGVLHRLRRLDLGENPAIAPRGAPAPTHNLFAALLSCGRLELLALDRCGARGRASRWGRFTVVVCVCGNSAWGGLASWPKGAILEVPACDKQVYQRRGRSSLLTSGACPAARTTRRDQVHVKREHSARCPPGSSPRGGRPAASGTPCGDRRRRAAARPAGMSDEDVAAVCGFVGGEPGGLPRALRALRLGPPCAAGGAPGMLSDGAWRALAGALAACARLEAAEVRARAPAGQPAAEAHRMRCRSARMLAVAPGACGCSRPLCHCPPGLFCALTSATACVHCPAAARRTARLPAPGGRPPHHARPGQPRGAGRG